MCYYLCTKIKTKTHIMLGKNKLPEDILGAIEIPTKEETLPLWEEKLQELEVERNVIFSNQESSEAIYPMSLDESIEEENSILNVSEAIEEEVSEEIVQEPQEEKVENFQSTIIYEKKPHTLFSSFWFLIKYITTSSVIFGILLLTTNFQAYYAIGYNLLFQEKMLQKQEGLINSVQAGNIEKETIENLSSAPDEETPSEEKNFHSLENFVSKAQNQDVNLDITITPYENRIVIPKI